MSNKAYYVISPDVWGNADDGWVVNDVANLGTIDIPLWDDDASVLEAVVEAGYLNPSVTLNDIQIDGDESMLYIIRFADHYPILHLQEVL